FVKLHPFGLVDLAALQGLQIKTYRSDRSLELVRDRVDEGIVLLIAPDLPDKENRVQDHAADDKSEEQHTENQHDPGSPVDHYPQNILGDGQRYEASTQGNEKRDRFAVPAACHKSRMVKAKVKGK